MPVLAAPTFFRGEAPQAKGTLTAFFRGGPARSHERQVSVMNAHRTLDSPLFRPLLFAGLAAFLFASLPLSLGMVMAPDIQRDRGYPDAQAQANRSDLKLEKTIRAALTEDAGLSEEAKRIKVVTANGSVILKGKVASASEKTRIEKIARQANRNGQIENNLEIAKP